MIRIAILGCTGSIGTSTLNVIRRYPELFRVVFLANKSKQNELYKLAKEFAVRDFYCGKGILVKNGKYLSFDSQYLNRAETYENADLVVNGIVGINGLLPTIAILNSKKILATANKESLVCAGNLINKLKIENKVEIRPLDSEHSTIWQCLDGINRPSKLIITASGGAFRDYTEEQLVGATAENALKHPNWIMGKKVTIDCATLVNKGMEIIEAKRLFGIDNVDAVLHRESIIHSLVETEDGTLIAGLSSPDMEIPIQYALTYPNRKQTSVKRLDLTSIGQLSFGKINEALFPCFSLCKMVSMYGDYAGTVLNAANEIAVEKYLNNKISFYDIAKYIEMAINKFGCNNAVSSVDDINRIDRDVREYTLKSIKE